MNADIIFHNTAVYTVDEARPTATAVAIKDNKIIYIGGDDGALALKSDKTRVIDGRGRTLMPGFIDSHFHLLWGARSLVGAQLYGIDDLPTLGEKLNAWAAENPDSEWVLGSGTSYALPSPEVDLNRHHLDAIIADRPMLLFSFDMHTVWLNTVGLEKTGLLYGHELDAGDAEVIMGEDGLATGALIEPAAYNLAVEQLPEPTQAEWLDILRNGIALAASLGITSVHNMTGDAEEMDLYGMLEDRGELTLRIYGPQLIEPHHEVTDIERLAVPLAENFNSDMLRSGFVKFFMDGVFESYSAVTLNGYPDQPDNYGEPIFAKEKFAAMAAEADRLGLQIAVHACGDGGVRQVLDGYETAQQTNGRRDSRHRVEHIELIDPADVPRFKELGVVASMQPLHSPLEENDSDLWPSRVAEKHWDLAFPWRTLREAGAHLAFGSDWPVVTLDPMLGLHAALNRVPWKPGHDSHNQTLAEAIAGYTRDAAWTEFMEHKKGQIKEGYLADLVLLSENIFELPPADIRQAKVELTICDGKVVFERD